MGTENGINCEAPGVDGIGSEGSGVIDELVLVVAAPAPPDASEDGKLIDELPGMDDCCINGRSPGISVCAITGVQFTAQTISCNIARGNAADCFDSDSCNRNPFIAPV